MIAKKIPWRQQPQTSVTADHRGLIFALNPIFGSNTRVHDSSRENQTPVITGSPTGNVITTGPHGRSLDIDFRGGSNGIGTLQLPKYDQASMEDDFTIVCGGDVLDTGFIGWANDNSGPNAFSFYSTSTSLNCNWADSGINVTTATLSGLSVATGSYQRVAMRKIGDTVDVFDHTSRLSASATNVTTGIFSSSGTSFTVGGGAIIGFNFYYLFNAALSINEIWDILDNPWKVYQSAQILQFPTAAVGTTAAITGTATASIDESDIVTGGKTIIITLTGDTWVAAGTGPIGSTADTQALIDGLDAATSPATGWNNEVRDKEVTTAVVRTSDTVATITLTASAAYDISSTETITSTIPAATLVTSVIDVTASPTFTVDAVVSGRIMGSLAGLGGLAGMGGIAGPGGGMAG